MNWVEIAWIMMIAASLMLGVVHLFVWQKQRSQFAHLLFFVLATSAAAYGAFELARMRAETPASLAVLARWSHVPLAMVILSIVAPMREPAPTVYVVDDDPDWRWLDAHPLR